MVELIPFILISFLIIEGCLGVRLTDIEWTEPLIRQLMDIYYGSSPLDSGHSRRMKQEWDRQLPQYANEEAKKLRKSAWNMIMLNYKEWERKPAAEREKLNRILQIIFKETDNGEPNHERRMLDKLLESRPEYRNQFEMIRAVVHMWSHDHVQRGTELNYNQVNWTPELKADLLQIIGRVRFMKGDSIRDRIKSRWLQMHGDINLKANSLLNYAYSLEDSKYEPCTEEKIRAKKKYDALFPEEREETTDKGLLLKEKKSNWLDQQKTDVLFIHEMLHNDRRNTGHKLKHIWAKMNKDLNHLSGKDLLTRVSRLKKTGYKPSAQHLLRAKNKFQKIAPNALTDMPEPPIRRKRPSKWNVEKYSHFSQIQDLPTSEHPPEGNPGPNEKHELRHNNPFDSYYERGETSTAPNPRGNDEHYENQERFSPLPYDDFHSTPDDYTYLQNNSIITSYHTGYYHDPCANYHYGSSSHSQFNQVPFELQRNFSDQYHHMWDHSGSRDHIPINTIPFGSLPNTPRSLHDPWNHSGTSSHHPNNTLPFGSLPNTPRPSHDSWDHGSSSGSFPNYQWHLGGSSNQSYYPPH